MFRWNIFNRSIFGNIFLGDYFLKIRNVNAVVGSVFFRFVSAFKYGNIAVCVGIYVSFICCSAVCFGNIICFFGFVNAVCGGVEKLVVSVIIHFTDHIHISETDSLSCFIIADIHKTVCICKPFIACTEKLIDNIGVMDIVYHTIDHFRIFSSAYGNGCEICEYSSRKSYACIARQKICDLQSCFGIGVYKASVPYL